jgi:LemA protein
MESQLQAARRIYNSEVNSYNNSVQMFPTNIIAGIFKFEVEEFFQINDEEKNNINVNI